MLNTMIVVKMINSNYTEWKKLFDEDAEKQEKFMKDTLVGKIDENTAVVTADIFDPEGMQTHISDPEQSKIFEEMGIEHTVYMLQPAPVPGS
ncbi:hypothetical protein N9357_00695 [bacterium]|jgi:hypothetical protein|nr:hypothetical protein [Candidatus Neomarinimicrobiota bacterium]MBT6009179.1 hypothetical protein [Rhodobacterales bacterium]MBT7560011.1 hypothetical protein [Rhodobacterales bacterium]MDB3916971.1 hypothetical protein [bacterium]